MDDGELYKLRSERDLARRDYECMNKFREAAELERDQLRYVLEKIYNSGQWYLSALEIDLHAEDAIDGETLERMARVVLRETGGGG